MKVNTIAQGSSGNLHTVSDSYTRLLIEAGLPFNKVITALNHDLNFAGCLITHEHQDHCKSAYDVSLHMPVYASTGTLASFKTYKSVAMRPFKRYSVGTLIVSSFPVTHNAKEPTGFIVYSVITNTTLVYITDANYTEYLMPKTDIMMMEINHSIDKLDRNLEQELINPTLYRNVQMNHFSLDDGLRFLKRNMEGVSELHIIHCSTTNLDIKLTYKEIRKIYNGKLYIGGKQYE